MVTDFTLQVVAFMQANLELLLPVLDLLFKSLLLLALVVYLEKISSPFFASHQRRQLWLLLLVLLGMFPLATLFLQDVANSLPLPADFTLVNVMPPELAFGTRAGEFLISGSWWTVVMVIYFVGLGWHLFKMLLSFSQTRRLDQFASYEIPDEARELLEQLRSQLGITRKIRLGDTHLTDSPVTFGTLRPTVIVPSTSYYDDLCLLENVLLHELGHIKRFDYLTYLAAYLLASCNWFNPFVWFALRRLSLESEFACDDEVLCSEQRRAEFANQLVSIARTSLLRTESKLAARAMASKGELTQRVEHILYGSCINQSGRTHSSFYPIAMLLCAFVLASAGKVFAIGEADGVSSENLRLVYSELPEYPQSAYEKGETGLTQFSFRVTAEGKVDPDSIIILYSSPQHTFDAASIAALKNFEFAPRRINGRNVATPGVMYSFRFDLRM
ncbi:MAG: M56 family metallopeptidase [Pseudomonadales bacterium]|nr:M56 family metallopeptidase [Pseudomonadales bacterium]